MQIKAHSNFSFQSHVPNKKFVLLGGFSPVSKNGNVSKLSEKITKY